MALLRGRARLGALTLAYPHTPPFLSWGRFEECAHTVSTFAQRQGQPRLCLGFVRLRTTTNTHISSVRTHRPHLTSHDLVLLKASPTHHPSFNTLAIIYYDTRGSPSVHDPQISYLELIHI